MIVVWEKKKKESSYQFGLRAAALLPAEQLVPRCGLMRRLTKC